MRRSGEEDEGTITSKSTAASQMVNHASETSSDKSVPRNVEMQITESDLAPDDVKSIDSVKSSDIHDYHRVELFAHAILSGSLENLHENFEALHRSQVILLTRLKLLEEKLNHIKDTNDKVIDNDIAGDLGRIKTIRKRLQSTHKKAAEIDKRVEQMNLKLCLDNV